MWGGPNIDNVTLYDVVEDWVALSQFLTNFDLFIEGIGQRTSSTV